MQIYIHTHWYTIVSKQILYKCFDTYQKPISESAIKHMKLNDMCKNIYD